MKIRIFAFVLALTVLFGSLYAPEKVYAADEISYDELQTIFEEGLQNNLATYGGNGNVEDYKYYIDVKVPYSAYTHTIRLYSKEPILFYKAGSSFAISSDSYNSGLFNKNDYFYIKYVHYEEGYNSSDLIEYGVGVLSLPTEDYDVAVSMILSSNHDIYDNINNLVFQKPLLPTVLTKVTKGLEMDPLKQILRILPIMTVCLVGYAGLRKALAILERILHQA